MFGLKNKITSFLPSGTREQLQNVLTVEWDNHKTVLVEVPGHEASRSNEVEMSGMSPGERSKYGRLGDDGDDDVYYSHNNFNSSNLSKPRQKWSAVAQSSLLDSCSSTSNSSTSPPRIQSPTSISKQRPPQLPARSISFHTMPLEDDNPFDENSTSYRSSLGLPPPLPPKPVRSETDYLRKSTLTKNEGNRPKRLSTKFTGNVLDGQAQNDLWNSSGWSETTSPTSSRGTRNSGQLEEQHDPFNDV